MSKRLRLFAGMLTVLLLALAPAVVPIGASVSPAAASVPSGFVVVGTGNCAQYVNNASSVTVQEISGNCVITFARVGATTWQPPFNVSEVRAVAVGGGGGGSGDGGDGGGGGETQAPDASPRGLSTTQSVAVTVGGGGSRGDRMADGWNISADSGGFSSIDFGPGSAFVVHANGGQGGAGWQNTTTALGGRGGTPSTNWREGGNGGNGPGARGMDVGTAGGQGLQIALSLRGVAEFFGGGGGGGSSGTGGGLDGSSGPLNGANGGRGGGGAGAYIYNGGTFIPYSYDVYETATEPSQTLIARCGDGSSMGATTGFDGLNGFGGGGGGGSANGDAVFDGNVQIKPSCQATANTSDDGERTAGGNGGSGVVIVSFAKPADPTITFAQPSNRIYGGAPFSAGATASAPASAVVSSLTTGVCTVLGGTVRFVAPGTCSLRASVASPFVATPVDRSFTVAPKPITMSVSIANRQWNGTTAAVVSGTPVLTGVVPGDAVGVDVTKISASFATPDVGSGKTVTVTLAAGVLTGAPADRYTVTVPVFPTANITQLTQAITFTSSPPSNVVSGTTYTPTATSTSGLVVSFAVTTGNGTVCSLSGGVVTFLTSGSCVVAADQAGNSNVAAAPRVTQTVTAGLRSQTITFNPLAARTYGDANFAPLATASSGLSATFASSTVGVCTVSGVSVTIVSAGTCTVTALQAGDSSFAAAPSVSQSFVVAKRPITMAVAIANRQWDNTLVATVSGAPTLSGLLLADVGFVAVDASRITATFDTAAVGDSKAVAVSLAAGVLTAGSSGDRSDNYVVTVSGAPTANITKATQSALAIAVDDAALVFGDTATLSSTGGSGVGAVLFIVVSGDCTITGTTVTASGGTTDCVVTAVKQADRNYVQVSAALTVAIVVSKATQSLTFTSLMPLSVVVGARHTLVAVTSAGFSAPVSVAAGEREVCSLSGGVVVFVGAGSCVVTASQAGTRNFAAAASISHTIVVREAPVSVPVVPPATTTPVSPVPVITTPIAPTAPTVQPALLGPVMTAGRGVDMNAGSQATIGGVPTRVITAPNNSGGATMQAGALRLGISPANPSAAAGASFASTGPRRSLELNVPAGQSTTMAGGGMLPGSTLQLWLPGQSAGAGAGADHRELARLSVAADGSFRGDVSFTANQSEAPLPIGRQVMQATGFDENGNQVVVDMVINISQGAPQPERIRLTNDLPAMDAGQLLATSAGVAEAVAIEVRPERGEVAVVSGSWQFLLTVSANTGTVASRGGGALVEVAQSGVATVSGSGFQPETRVDMWLFSEPTLLGSVVVAADGTFTTEFSLDARFATLGAHTLQLQGVGVDGFVKAANLGVSVVDGAGAGAGATAFAGWWMWVLAVVAVMAVMLTLVFVRRRSAAGGNAGRLQGDVASWGARVVGALRL